MGKSNRQRRAAKARKRQSRKRADRARGRRSTRIDDAGHDDHRARDDGPDPTGRDQRDRHRRHDSHGPDGPDVEALFRLLAHLSTVEPRPTIEGPLVRLAEMPPRAVADAAQKVLESTVAALWDSGWQPADADRQVRRELGADEQAVLLCVLAADAARYESLGRRVAPAWMDQLDVLGAVRWWDPDVPYLPQLDMGWYDTLLAAVRLMALLGVTIPLPTLTPPPSQWHDGMATAPSRPSNLPPGLLDKVRALLAKAEATTFDAEAEAFTAKAQELMTRHRIDRAVLAHGGTTSDDEPVGRRIGTDDPYAEAKAMLLGGIAAANGGRSVWSKGMGFATVFAFDDELDAIEELYTSLLVQATAALQREGPKRDYLGRSRTTRFRRSFLAAFAGRIGERLRESADHVVDEAVADAARAAAEATPDLLPILAARDAAVDEAADRAFPDTQQFRVSASDGEGWHAGRIFGGVADISIGAPLDERAAS